MYLTISVSYADDSGTGRRDSNGFAVRAVSAPRGPAGARPRLSSTDLFDGRRELVIVHGGHEYVLRITKSDKLILTK